MGAIFNTDIFCDDCAEQIRNQIAAELWEKRFSAVCADGTPVAEFDDYNEFVDYLGSMNERDYDSCEFPKDCDETSEADCPQHCGGCSAFFENDLTSYGEEYVKEAVRDSGDDSAAHQIWKPFYDYIDFDDDEGDEDDDA